MRSFFRRVEEWLDTASDCEAMPTDDVDDILLLGENIHRHLTAMVVGGEAEVVALGRSVGSLVESISTISGLLDNQTDMRTFIVSTTADGRKGRPSLNISQEQLRFLLGHGFTSSDIAVLLGVSRSTISRRMRDWNLRMSDIYSDLDDIELDRAVLEIKGAFPDAGYVMMDGLLKARGIVIQRHRIRLSVARVDPTGVAERWATSIPRRAYRVGGSNALWHIDGNHKLIRSGCIMYDCLCLLVRLWPDVYSCPPVCVCVCVCLHLCVPVYAQYRLSWYYRILSACLPTCLPVHWKHALKYALRTLI